MWALIITEQSCHPFGWQLFWFMGVAPPLSPAGRSPFSSWPLPLPLPRREGRNHRDTPMANHQHLTTITQHPSLAVTLCELCMPEAFCGLETVRKKALLTLWALWEINLPSVREKPPQRVVCESSHRVGVFFFSQKNTDEQIIQRPERWWPLPPTPAGPSPFPSPEGKGSDYRDTLIKRM